jgi:hypothetical protein
MFLNFREVKVSLAGSVRKLHLPLKIKIFIWLALQALPQINVLRWVLLMIINKKTLENI